MTQQNLSFPFLFLRWLVLDQLDIEGVLAGTGTDCIGLTFVITIFADALLQILTVGTRHWPFAGVAVVRFLIFELLQVHLLSELILVLASFPQPLDFLLNLLLFDVIDIRWVNFFNFSHQVLQAGQLFATASYQVKLLNHTFLRLAMRPSATRSTFRLQVMFLVEFSVLEYAQDGQLEDVGDVEVGGVEGRQDLEDDR